MNKFDRFPSILIVGFLLLYVCILSAVTPWTGDDITYMFSFADGRPISSVFDVWFSQIAHWNSCNGRFLVHYIVQFVLVFIGRGGFVFLNACAYVWLLIIILRLCEKDFNDWRALLSICILVLLALPTKFVPTCQIGYIWMFDVVLFFYLEWQKHIINREAISLWNLIWLTPLSFLAGTSQEAIVIGIGFSLVVYSARNLRSLGMVGWFMLISFGIGALLLCLSPANFRRVAEVHGTIGNLSVASVKTVKFFLYQRISYVMLLLIVYLLLKQKIHFLDIYRTSPMLFNAWAALIIFNIVVGVFGNRQLFGSEIIAAIISLLLFYKYPPKGILLPQIIITSLFVVLVSANTFSAFHAKKVYQDILDAFEKSDDGTVKYKLQFFDLNYRESGPNDAWSWYVTSTVDKLLHINGNNGDKTLKIIE